MLAANGANLLRNVHKITSTNYFIVVAAIAAIIAAIAAPTIK